MKILFKNSWVLLAALSVPVHAATVAFNKLSHKDVAHFLGWVSTKKANNLCDGYYKEPAIVLNFPDPGSIRKTKVRITATKPVSYALSGDAVLLGRVTITQPGREIVADKIVLHRDKKTHKLTNGDLTGHVHFREYGRVLIGDSAHINFVQKTFVIHNAIYRMWTVSPTGKVNLWGRARKILRDKDGVLYLYNATYSTSKPSAKTWQINSKKLRLDRTTGIGTVHNAVFLVQGIPVGIMPYYRFPIDKRRKSGLLYPLFGYSRKTGFDLTLPYYLNLAPNYDATLTPRFIYKRGVLLGGKFRYLTSKSKGELRAAYIFNDRYFKQFKNDSNTPNPALARLKNSSNNRGMVSFKDRTHFNSQWSSKLDLNYVSDDYFYRDFGNVPSIINGNQLLNRADLKYESEHWNFLGRVMAFQTLHLITQEPALNQYSRLPQLDLTGDYPNQKYGLDYHFANEFVYFDHARLLATGNRVVTGGRLNVQPSIGMPYNWAGGYLSPNFQLPMTFYELNDQASGTKKSIKRVLPVFDVDGGLTFERALHFFGGDYTQTLEPRLFYLYVPYHNQDNYPLFDTNISTFSFDSLFRTNRFSGIDRFGDANQVSVGLTSRFIDANTGEEKIRASIGQTFAFQKHRVCIAGNCNADPLVKDNFSPLVGELKYYLNKAWNVTGTGAYDFANKRLNNAGVTFQYRYTTNGVANFGYNYLYDGDTYNKRAVDLNRLDLSLAWPVTRNWRLLGDWNYNISSHSPNAYVLGVEYNSCSWAMRLVSGNFFTGYSDDQRSLYDHRVYVQFMLKGLGNIGSSGVGSLLTSRIPGFNDMFKTG